MPCLRKSRSTAMCQIMPPRPGRSSQHGAGLLLVLDVDEPHDPAVHLGYELDARAVVMLLLPLHCVVVRAVQEGEHTAFEPASLVRVVVRADDDVARHGTVA